MPREPGAPDDDTRAEPELIRPVFVVKVEPVLIAPVLPIEAPPVLTTAPCETGAS